MSIPNKLQSGRIYEIKNRVWGGIRVGILKEFDKSGVIFYTLASTNKSGGHIFGCEYCFSEQFKIKEIKIIDLPRYLSLYTTKMFEDILKKDNIWNEL